MRWTKGLHYEGLKPSTLWNIPLGIILGSWVATDRQHQETRAYWPYHKGKKCLPGGPVQKRHAISTQLSVRFENKVFLCTQMLRQKKEGKKAILSLISPKTKPKQPFYLVRYKPLRMWDMSLLDFFFVFNLHFGVILRKQEAMKGRLYNEIFLTTETLKLCVHACEWILKQILM